MPDIQRLRGLVVRLVEQETIGNANEPEEEGRVFRVCDKLRQTLSSVTGNAGYQALLNRALALAKAESPKMSPICIGPNGALQDLEGRNPCSNPAEIVDGEIILVTHMLTMLWVFLGEALTLRLVQNVWPEASFNSSAPQQES